MTLMPPRLLHTRAFRSIASNIYRPSPCISHISLCSRMPPTHFLCLPLITPTSRPQLEQSLAHLREITKHGDCKIPESAYRPLGVLHLTLGVMSLTPERLESALKLLQDTDLDALLRWAGDSLGLRSRLIQSRRIHPLPKPTTSAQP